MIASNIEDSRFNGRPIGELVQLEDDIDDSDVVLMRYTVNHHAKDTDDIVVELSPEENHYDKKHSKRWNKMVDIKAKELEQQMESEEKMENAKEKAT